MSIEVLTEEEAQASEYYTNLLLKVKEILKANGSILKAGFYSVKENVFIGSRRALPSLPAIHIEGARHTEGYLTYGNRENTITFRVFIWFYTVWADTEENEKQIHQLGDRLMEVFRQNEDLDGLARQIPSMDVAYDTMSTQEGGFLRAGLLVLEIAKDVSI
jgi:hypothetical protein